MKNIFVIVVLSLTVLCCSDRSLDEQRVKEILLSAKAYPQVMKYRIFCGQTTTVEKVIEKGLDKEGLLTAQLAHTPEDVGQPLIRFSEKAKPYLLTTSDTARALDVQVVKLADEELLDVGEINIAENGKRAEVMYTIKFVNKTPFFVLADQKQDSVQQRKTFFSNTEKGWQWDGKIVKIAGR